MLQTASRWIKEILFPAFCCECNTEGMWWCPACRAKHPPSLVTACPVCGATTKNGEGCGTKCQAESPLDGITAFFNYEETGPIGRLIKQFKYHYASDLAGLWKEILATDLPLRRGGLGWDQNAPTIIPVPLHPRRARERGFNQAALIAKLLADQYHCNYNDTNLIRQKYTSQQAKLTRPERHANVSDAFVWNSATPSPERILLVDDVFTTGATMQACARELKKQGAHFVWGVTMARD